jgi:hypothetical protein
MKRAYLLMPLIALAAAQATAEPRVYDTRNADQFLSALGEDIVPADPASREDWARHEAWQAAIFGRVAFLTYRQMWDQAIDSHHAGYVGFNRFAHDRVLAGPDYAPFKTPNADTLYSNAYLDLTQGPVLLTVPDTGGRYYTASLLDLYGNAANISARTIGTRGGRFLIATTDWGGHVPEGVTLFRVTQPYMWILLRIEAEDRDALPAARRVQDGFDLSETAHAPTAPAYPDPARFDDPAACLRLLDWIVDNAGVRREEVGFVHQLRNIGVGGTRSVADALADPAIAKGVAEGFADANAGIAHSIAQSGTPVGGWHESFDIGRYGFNYLGRAVVNTLGTGANVRLENFPFTTFSDADGEPLDGGRYEYRLRLAPPPPADFFWSVTVYDRKTLEPFPNSAGKYLVSGRTPGLVRAADGSVTVTFARDAKGPNAIPVPDGPFYVALRAQGPQVPLLTGQWLPAPITKKKGR